MSTNITSSGTTWSQSCLWLVNRFLRRSVPAKPLGSARFYPSGRIGDITTEELIEILVNWWIYWLIPSSVLSQGSVVVNFDLQFSQHIDEKEAEQQLIAGLQEVESTEFVIDIDSIQISGIQ